MQSLKLAPMKVPEALTPEIAAACALLVPSGLAEFVNRRPSADSVVNKCTYNVLRYLETQSGEMILGWEICVWDKVMVDCIGHAVVRVNNQLLCVSASRYPDTRLLFLPDPSLSFDVNDPQARMPHKQVAISNRPEVRRLIEIEAANRRIRVNYPVSSGSIAVTSEDALLLERLGAEKRRLALKITLATNDHVSKCFCGSGKKFRKCHRPDIEFMLTHA